MCVPPLLLWCSIIGDRWGLNETCVLCCVDIPLVFQLSLSFAEIMAKKHKSDPNRLFKALIGIVFALIVSLFLYFAHRYYVFSRENGNVYLVCHGISGRVLICLS